MTLDVKFPHMKVFLPPAQRYMNAQWKLSADNGILLLLLPAASFSSWRLAPALTETYFSLESIILDIKSLDCNLRCVPFQNHRIFLSVPFQFPDSHFMLSWMGKPHITHITLILRRTYSLGLRALVMVSTIILRWLASLTGSCWLVRILKILQVFKCPKYSK